MNTFEELYSGYFGETIDNVKQIAHHNFTGQELKDFVIECQSQCLQQAVERITEKIKIIERNESPTDSDIWKIANNSRALGLDSAVASIRQLLKELE